MSLKHFLKVNRKHFNFLLSTNAIASRKESYHFKHAPTSYHSHSKKNE